MNNIAKVALVASSVNGAGNMKKMLDDMAVYFGKEGDQYDPEYYANLTSCLGKFDDDLLPQSQEDAWTGMINYFNSNGTQHDYMNRTDTWGGCTPDTLNTRCDVGDYKENTLKYFGDDKMIIYEPCNYASNVAYYHSATRVCDYPDWTGSQDQIKGQKRAFATLAMGSAMWHGSHTYVGYSFDNNMIAVISYLAHQQSVSSFASNSSILHELSPTPRSKSGLQVSEDLVTMFSNEPVQNWAQILDEADLPHVYFITFAALLSSIFSVVLPWFVTQFVITKLAYLIIPTEDADFIVKQYLPELKVAVKDIKLTRAEADTVVEKFIGMIMKIIYAFLWQEFFIPLPELYHTLPNEIGAALMPHWNAYSTQFSGFAQTDDDVTNAHNLYPGDAHCRTHSPHALWHEESANGLLEIVFLADYVHGLLSTKFAELKENEENELFIE